LIRLGLEHNRARIAIPETLVLGPPVAVSIAGARSRTHQELDGPQLSKLERWTLGRQASSS
jgi:hypothetical protein